MQKLLPLLMVLGCSQVAAQTYEGPAAARRLPGAEALRYDAHSGQLNYVRFNDAARPSLESAQAAPDLRQLWQTRDLRAVQTTEDRLGMAHTRLQAYHQGHPVEGAITIVHSQQGRIHAVNGELPTEQGFTGRATLTVSQAKEKALAHIDARLYLWDLPGADDFLRKRTGDPQATYAPAGALVYVPLQGDFASGQYRLAWKFDIYAIAPLSRDYIYVDAENGDIIWRLSRLHTADAIGTAVTAYSGTRPITTDQMGPGSYRLREFVRSIETYNLQRREAYSSAVDFWDTDNVWDNVNAEMDQYATDCHVALEVAFDYYQNTHGWVGVDGNHMPLVAYVHYDTTLGNAFWDGEHMGFGDGNPWTFSSPTTTPDIVGHELAHGITQFSAGLFYQGESGALNEAYSDIFGKVIESIMRPSGWSWVVGAQCTPGGAGIRDMKNPNHFYCADTYKGRYWVPNSDVHANSSIGNKWFQVLAEGETGINDIGNAYSVTGIGMEKAAAIAFRCLSVYLGPTSNYEDARFYAVEAARDLYGDCSNEQTQTANAWYAVGLGGGAKAPPQVDFQVLQPTDCKAPATFQFENGSSIGQAYHWDFGDGTTSTQRSPVHTYTNFGSYTVKLVVTDCIGQRDSLVRPNYVQVDSQLPCIVLIPQVFTSVTTTKACTGLLLDPGGYGDYPPQQGGSLRIHPEGAAHISLHLQKFSTEPFWDLLRIYDGPDAKSPMVVSWSGTAPPLGGRTWVSSGPFVLIEFVVNGTVQSDGFELLWDCMPAVAPPVAAFEVGAALSCDGILSFKDVAVDGVETWYWDFGDGVTSTEKFPLHEYQQSGTYSITLIVCNDIGCDTLTRQDVFEVDLQNTCYIPMPQDFTELKESCHGRIQDPGGKYNYPDSLITSLTLSYGTPTLVSLDFKSFSLEPGHDFLIVHYQKNGVYTRHGSYSGHTLPDDGQIKLVTTGVMLTFISDSAVNFPGFKLEWQAYNVSPDIVAQFDAPAAVSPVTNVQFENQSRNVYAFEWDFGDGTTSTERNPVHRYQVPGTYTVTLQGKGYVGFYDACIAQYSRQIEVCRACAADPDTPNLAVWPNPSNGLLEVVAGLNGEAVGRLVVFDAVGRRILAVSHAGAPSLHRQIDLRDAEDGMYFVRYETDAGDVVRKVLLQR
jgi:bacillolysin